MAGIGSPGKASHICDVNFYPFSDYTLRFILYGPIGQIVGLICKHNDSSDAVWY
jgi:hypothetical protein